MDFGKYFSKEYGSVSADKDYDILSMFADYLFEREEKNVVHTDAGFAVYKMLEESVYLSDIYIKPDLRTNYEATKLADIVVDIAKAEGKTKMIGSVDIKAKEVPRSMMVLLKYGMKPIHTEGTMIYFEKGI